MRDLRYLMAMSLALLLLPNHSQGAPQGITKPTANATPPPPTITSKSVTSAPTTAAPKPSPTPPVSQKTIASQSTPQQATSGATWEPVIPLPSVPDLALGGDEMMRDPKLAEPPLVDDMAAAQVMQEVKNLLGELKYTKGPRQFELHHEIYRNYVSYTYFLEDAIRGRVDSELSPATATKKLLNARVEVIRHGVAMTKGFKDKRLKSRAMYHIVLSRYFLGKNPEAALSHLAAVSKNLPPEMAQRVQYLAAMHQLRLGNRAVGRAALEALLPSLPRPGKLNAHLALAEFKSGVIGEGQRIGPTDPKYVDHLSTVVQLITPEMGLAEREDLFARVVRTWVAAEGSRINWAASPFSLVSFQKMVGRYALMERVALQSWQKGDRAGAMQTYRQVAKFMVGRPLAALIDQRILDLVSEEYKRSKDAIPLEKELLALVKKYQDDSILGKGQEKKAEAASQRFIKQYQTFVNSLVAVALKPETPSKIRNDTIGVAHRYEKRIKGEDERSSLRVKIAQMHVMEKRHKEAVAIYWELTENAKGSEAFEYLRPAMVSQRILADWPVKAPWGGYSAGHEDDRSHLRSMYRRLSQLQGAKLDWDAVAHEGLLGVSIGKISEAFALWEKALGKDAKGEHAAHAAGMMLGAYQKQNNWSKVEAIARLAISNKMRPMVGKVALNPVTLLADALYFGGKNTFAAKQFGASAKKFAEFTRLYPKEQRRAEALYLMSLAYSGSNQHPDALATLTTLVKGYPKSKFYRDALLNGGSWATGMGAEDATMFFYQRYLNQFRDGAKSAEIRQQLISLYLARQLYSAAGRLIREQGQVKGATVEDKLKAALAYMELEERYGDKNKARAAAKDVLALGGKDQSIQAIILAFEARRAQAENQTTKLMELEKQLATMNPSLPEVTETLGYVRFYILETNAKKPKDEIINIGVSDPAGTLSRFYQLHALMAAPYQRICNHPEVSYCGPSMLRLSQETRDMIKRVNVLNIPSSLDAKTVNEFNQKKAELIRHLNKEADEAGRKAEEVLVQGNAHPDLVQEIFWTNSNDWNFDRIGGEGGKGYVQWDSSRRPKSSSKAVMPTVSLND